MKHRRIIWTSDLDDSLKVLIDNGYDLKDVAPRIGCSEAQVKYRMRLLKLRLKSFSEVFDMNLVHEMRNSGMKWRAILKECKLLNPDISIHYHQLIRSYFRWRKSNVKLHKDETGTYQ